MKQMAKSKFFKPKQVNCFIYKLYILPFRYQFLRRYLYFTEIHKNKKGKSWNTTLYFVVDQMEEKLTS